jgi:hypothetical protein
MIHDKEREQFISTLKKTTISEEANTSITSGEPFSSRTREQVKAATTATDGDMFSLHYDLEQALSGEAAARELKVYRSGFIDFTGADMGDIFYSLWVQAYEAGYRSGFDDGYHVCLVGGYQEHENL